MALLEIQSWLLYLQLLAALSLTESGLEILILLVGFEVSKRCLNLMYVSIRERARRERVLKPLPIRLMKYVRWAGFGFCCFSMFFHGNFYFSGWLKIVFAMFVLPNLYNCLWRGAIGYSTSEIVLLGLFYYTVAAQMCIANMDRFQSWQHYQRTFHLEILLLEVLNSDFYVGRSNDSCSGDPAHLPAAF